MAKEFNPRVILLEKETPSQVEIETCSRIRNHHATRLIPIIFICGSDCSKHRIQAFFAGADDYVIRPYGTLELVARVESKIRRMNEQMTFL